jgi:hypothetical protein
MLAAAESDMLRQAKRKLYKKGVVGYVRVFLSSIKREERAERVDASSLFQRMDGLMDSLGGTVTEQNVCTKNRS